MGKAKSGKAKSGKRAREKGAGGAKKQQQTAKPKDAVRRAQNKPSKYKKRNGVSVAEAHENPFPHSYGSADAEVTSAKAPGLARPEGGAAGGAQPQAAQPKEKQQQKQQKPKEKHEGGRPGEQ